MMRVWLAGLIGVWAPAWADPGPSASVQAVRSPATEAHGWTDRGTRRTDVGQVRMWVKPMQDAYCVRAATLASAPLERLLGVAADIPGHVAWSTQQLTVSEVLSQDAGTLTYWQYLDVPNWMLVSDRYWVVRSQTERLDDGTARFTWVQLPPDQHPTVDTQARTHADDAIRLPVTIGEWVFTPKDDGTWVSYTNCADPGGKLPDWVVRFAATKTVPENVADLVREGVR